MQCGVYKNPDDSQSYAPYLLDVQADMLNSLETRIMAPLVRFLVSLRSQEFAGVKFSALAARVQPGGVRATRLEFGRRAHLLHPVFTVCGEDFVMATHLLAAIRSSGLGRAVESLTMNRTDIISTLADTVGSALFVLSALAAESWLCVPRNRECSRNRGARRASGWRLEPDIFWTEAFCCGHQALDSSVGRKIHVSN